MRWLADLILIVHFGIALFIVAGLLLIVAGAYRQWRWVRNRWLRGLHLFAIAFVAIETLLGIVCPLTVWEDALRGSTQEQGFIAHWVGRLLYYDLPSWVFTLAYLAFAAATLLAWFKIPPRPRGKTLTALSQNDLRCL